MKRKLSTIVPVGERGAYFITSLVLTTELVIGPAGVRGHNSLRLSLSEKKV